MASTTKYVSVFRIALKRYINDKKGEGTFKYGGRWTPEGHYTIYASESRALSSCEFMINNNISEKPLELSIMEIRIPKSVKINNINKEALPCGWSKPLTNFCKDIGKEWLKKEKYCVLKVPSAYIEEEFNYLINPFHEEYKKIKFCKPSKFLLSEKIIKNTTK